MSQIAPASVQLELGVPTPPIRPRRWSASAVQPGLGLVRAVLPVGLPAATPAPERTASPAPRPQVCATPRPASPGAPPARAPQAPMQRTPPMRHTSVFDDIAQNRAAAERCLRALADAPWGENERYGALLAYMRQPHIPKDAYVELDGPLCFSRAGLVVLCKMREAHFGRSTTELLLCLYEPIAEPVHTVLYPLEQAAQSPDCLKLTDAHRAKWTPERIAAKLAALRPYLHIENDGRTPTSWQARRILGAAGSILGTAAVLAVAPIVTPTLIGYHRCRHFC